MTQARGLATWRLLVIANLLLDAGAGKSCALRQLHIIPGAIAHADAASSSELEKAPNIPEP